MRLPEELRECGQLSTLLRFVAGFIDPVERFAQVRGQA
jgi:hypothetical protein